jgi:ABC-type multidrug transport system fused ATPase/permease subunit
MTPYKGSIVLLAIILLVNILLRIINPRIIKFYIDSVSKETGTELLYKAAILFLTLAIAQQFLVVISVYISQNLAWGSTNLLRSDLFRHSMDLDMSFHNKYKPGDMIERIDGDSITLSNFFSKFTLDLLTNVLLLIGVIISLMIESISLGILFLLYVFDALVFVYLFRDIAVKYWRITRDKTTELFGFIEESMSGLEDLRAQGANENVMRKFHHYSKEEYDATNTSLYYTSFFIFSIWGIAALAFALVFLAGIPPFLYGKMSMGTLVMVFMYAGLIIWPIMSILGQIQDLQLAGASIERINELFQTEREIEDTGTESMGEKSIHIEFKDVSFEYSENNPVIKNLSFDLEPNKILGLIGPTGSGKTTIARLIFRLYDYQTGEITFNGVNTKKFSLREIRNNIAMVTQKVELFNASVRENITFFDKTILDEKIIEVLYDVGLKSWFNKLPEGLDTKIQSNEGLSAGEAQLLALARVFLKEPKFVIMDEASSRLDPATERLIEKAVDRLVVGRTVIIIAHRLATLERVDKILILENGEMVEYGERVKLENDSTSRFYELLQTGMEEMLE